MPAHAIRHWATVFIVLIVVALMYGLLTRAEPAPEVDAYDEGERHWQAIEKKLARAMSVAYENERLETVLDDIAKAADVNLVVNWRALEEAGIEPGTEVTLHLNNVSVHAVLDHTLDQVGGDLIRLGYSVDDHGILHVSTRDDLDRNTLIRTYDIRSIVRPIPKFVLLNDPPADGHYGSESIFSDDYDDNGYSREEMITQVMDLIRDTIDMDNWREYGGLVSSMSELNGFLIINTTHTNHREVESLLDQIAEFRNRMLQVQGRFVTVSGERFHQWRADYAGGGFILSADAAERLLTEIDAGSEGVGLVGVSEFEMHVQQRGNAGHGMLRELRDSENELVGVELAGPGHMLDLECVPEERPSATSSPFNAARAKLVVDVRAELAERSSATSDLIRCRFRTTNRLPNGGALLMAARGDGAEGADYRVLLLRLRVR